MAYVNVAEWKTEQVCEWLKGLDNSVLPYVHSFTNNKVNGQQLLSLRPEDLEQLSVLKLGHQEIILEAVEYLRNFHYELDRENLQLLALRLSCQAHSLHNELCRHTGSKPVTTQTLSDVVAVAMAVKPLVRWLDRPPFSGQLEYNDKKTELLKLSIEMSTCAQRDRFAEKPIEEIRNTCGELAKLSDYIIQDISDPMILQPASLDLATLKKRPGDELGFYILPSFHGTHQIAEIKFSSAAHQCGKMEEGDEIVQVNYQTVVGWERKNVLELFNESPAEVLLTLKRRPRHTKVYGQIYIKPYRLPSNKKTPYTTRWQHNLPSPRPELLTIPDFTMPLPRSAPKDPSPEPTSIIATVNMLDTMATDSSSSDSEIEPPLSGRLYATKPRSLVQRRATITGASPTTKHAVDIEQFWKELKQERNTTFQLRDKAASCAHGLDSVPSCLRPQTCLGIEQTKRKKKVGGEPTDEKRVQFNDKLCQADSTQLNELDHRIINEQIFNNVETHNNNNNNNNNNSNTVIDNALSIQSNNSDITVPSNKCSEMSNNSVDHDNETVGGSNVVGSFNCRRDRGKLDKSHSTPAYDLTNTVTSTDVFNDNNTVTSNYHNKLNVGFNFATNSSSINIDKTDVNSCVENIATDNLINEKQKNNTKVDIEIVNGDKNIMEQIQHSIDKKFILHCDNDVMINLKVPDNLNESNTRESINSHDKICELNLVKIHNNNENRVSSEIINNKSNELIENNIVTSKISELVLKNDINNVSSRESSEEKSESTTSYMDGIYSSSSEAETPLKSEIIPVSICTTDTKNNNPTISTHDIEYPIVPNQCVNIRVPVKQLSAAFNQMHAASGTKEILTLPIHDKKREQIKLKQTPPEPPPRKYFTRPAPLNLNINDVQPDIPERPKVPERPDIKRDTPKDILNEKRSNSETITTVPFHQREYFEGYRDFVDKSTDFIDEPPNTPVAGDKKPPTSTTGVDHFGYSEIYEKQLRDDKPSFEKYELFTEKFGNSSPIMFTQSPPELPLRMADSPDGAGCSRQAPTPELKVRTLEKEKHYDKGVVNRAMMVARSIGLHGSSKVSSGSPRSSRKRSILLAKRRNVSVKDIQGDLDGWLTYRSRGAGGAWARSWFVLKGSSLYRFKNQESTKSDCLIALQGFTAAQASEVKSRKFAFKVYHTGTVFYFAADNDDNLSLWLDSINKVTLGADSHNRSSGIFSETDESDTESSKNKSKGTSTPDSKSSCEKTFGSLKKIVRKDSATKETSETGGASLDRKYLRFLGARTQNVPVPTAQFRSYRRVLPSSTPRKPESSHNSPDLRVMVAGSTFYGLSSSHSATDVPNTSQDMSDYRQATDRSQSCRSRRSDDLRGFVTLEEFMLSHQNENRPRAFSNRSASPHLTPLTNDHVSINHRHFEDNNASYGRNLSFDNGYVNNGMIYGHPRNGAESPVNSNRNESIYARNSEGRTMSEHQVDMIYGQRYESDVNGVRADEYSKRLSPLARKSSESTISHVKRMTENAVYYPPKQNETNYRQTIPRECQRDQKSISTFGRKQEYTNRISEISNSRDDNNISMSRVQSRNDTVNGNRLKDHRPLRESNRIDIAMPPHPLPRRYIKDNGYSGSSGDLSSCTTSETLQRAKKEATVSRKGSFNLSDRNGRDHSSSERHWIDSLRRSDKKIPSAEKIRLKNVAQYQPPPMPNSPSGQDVMKPAFEMHLDKGNEHVQKVSRLKSLFGSKNSQKPTTLDFTKEPQKTLLGSPRLHRALFRDKSVNQRQNGRSGGQSPGDSGFSQSFSSYSGISHSHTLSQSFSSVSSVGDWSPDGPIDCSMAGHRTCQKRPSNANKNSLPPTLPYIPPPTSPPPDDYPGLEYPPVFEPGTYSLSDASLLRTRSVKNQKDIDE